MSAVAAQHVAPSVPYVAQWRKALINAGLNARAIAIGTILAEYADFHTGMNARPSYATIAEHLGGCSSYTVARGVKDLKDAGLLTVTKKARNGYPATYLLVFPEESTPSTSALPEETHREVSEPSTEGFVGTNPGTNPGKSAALPSHQVGVEEDARDRGAELRDALVDGMDLVDPREAARARQSRRVLARARLAARAGRTVEDVQAAWLERVPEDGFDNGPGFAVALLIRVTEGRALRAPQPPRGTRGRKQVRGGAASAWEGVESSETLQGWT